MGGFVHGARVSDLRSLVVPPPFTPKLDLQGGNQQTLEPTPNSMPVLNAFDALSSFLCDTSNRECCGAKGTPCRHMTCL